MTSEEAFKHASENSLADEYHGTLWKGLRMLGTMLYWLLLVYLLASAITLVSWSSR